MTNKMELFRQLVSLTRDVIDHGSPEMGAEFHDSYSDVLDFFADAGDNDSRAAGRMAAVLVSLAQLFALKPDGLEAFIAASHSYVERFIGAQVYWASGGIV